MDLEILQMTSTILEETFPLFLPLKALGCSCAWIQTIVSRQKTKTLFVFGCVCGSRHQLRKCTPHAACRGSKMAFTVSFGMHFGMLRPPQGKGTSFPIPGKAHAAIYSGSVIFLVPHWPVNVDQAWEGVRILQVTTEAKQVPFLGLPCPLPVPLIIPFHNSPATFCRLPNFSQPLCILNSGNGYPNSVTTWTWPLTTSSGSKATLSGRVMFPNSFRAYYASRTHILLV